jgi:translation initiation factor IF-1
MPREDAFEVEGVVIEALSNGTWRLELSNGHRLLGFATRRIRENLDLIGPGDKVRIKLAPFDLSTGRILGKITI